MKRPVETPEEQMAAILAEMDALNAKLRAAEIRDAQLVKELTQFQQERDAQTTGRATVASHRDEGGFTTVVRNGRPARVAHVPKVAAQQQKQQRTEPVTGPSNRYAALPDEEGELMDDSEAQTPRKEGLPLCTLHWGSRR